MSSWVWAKELGKLNLKWNQRRDCARTKFEDEYRRLVWQWTLTGMQPTEMWHVTHGPPHYSPSHQKLDLSIYQGVSQNTLRNPGFPVERGFLNSFNHAKLCGFPSQPTTHVTSSVSFENQVVHSYLSTVFFFFFGLWYSRAHYVALFLDINKVSNLLVGPRTSLPLKVATNSGLGMYI